MLIDAAIEATIMKRFILYHMAESINMWYNIYVSINVKITFQRAGDIMTALKEEAIRMIGNLPEDKVQYVIKYMQTITINRKEREQSEKMKAFSDLENLRLHLPMDFDYEKELEDARKEKYGIIS